MRSVLAFHNTSNTTIGPDTIRRPIACGSKIFEGVNGEAEVSERLHARKVADE
jgi:hypothetical protein